MLENIEFDYIIFLQLMYVFEDFNCWSLFDLVSDCILKLCLDSFVCSGFKFCEFLVNTGKSEVNRKTI